MRPPEQPGLCPNPPAAPLIFSIGHSTRKLEELIAVLKHYGVQRLVDIRHFPASRHNPQFNKDQLQTVLPAAGIAYHWLEALGGYRSGGYLAYMQTPQFAAGLAELQQLARERPTAFMCAEIKWFQCHRRRVSDALAERGWQVLHIFTEKRADPHRLKTNRIRCEVLAARAARLTPEGGRNNTPPH
jgi:uncharacterized protein (DUF488 family)